ncbi:hypothetical protein HB852_00695 [Listeria grandensis]|uniref:Imm59 family immunity protein n=1 Tax=Listeria grandensis TaxID=1494963 RepID=UPI00162480B4|nr:Imm59 family immunity protein [Listeria grandensis]MBC1473134.1 hypothetical protein [Listeria grandensis]
MNYNLDEIEVLLENDISLLGYEDLRYSLFAGEENYRDEYQVRIEYTNGKFEVYMTGERASVLGKSGFEDFWKAYKEFMYKLQLTVLSNREHIKSNEPPEYPCSLWDK